MEVLSQRASDYTSTLQAQILGNGAVQTWLCLRVSCPAVSVLSWPSCRTFGFNYHICDSEFPSNLDRIKRSLDFSPERVWPSPTADLKRVSNLAWSCAVMNDSLMFGIRAPPFDARRPFGFEEVEDPVWKEAAIWLKPVGCDEIGDCAGGA